MRFIGLDVSITGTGFACLDKRLRCTNSGVIKSAKKERDEVRFLNITNAILEKCKIEPTDLVCIEDYAFSAKGQITRIAELAGLVKHTLYHKIGCTFYLCSPQHLKMFVTGKGNAHKQIVMKDAFRRWGFNANDDNEVDAYVLARLLHSMFTQSDEERTAYEQKAVEGVSARNEALVKEAGRPLRASEGREATSDKGEEPEARTEPPRALPRGRKKLRAVSL